MPNPPWVKAFLKLALFLVFFLSALPPLGMLIMVSSLGVGFAFGCVGCP